MSAKRYQPGPSPHHAGFAEYSGWRPPAIPKSRPLSLHGRGARTRDRDRDEIRRKVVDPLPCAQPCSGLPSGPRYFSPFMNWTLGFSLRKGLRRRIGNGLQRGAIMPGIHWPRGALLGHRHGSMGCTAQGNVDEHAGWAYVGVPVTRAPKGVIEHSREWVW